MESVWKTILVVATVMLIMPRASDGKKPNDKCGFKKVKPPQVLTGSDLEVFYGPSNLVVCENYKCEQISYSKLESNFCGLFLTEDEYLETLRGDPVCPLPEVPCNETDDDERVKRSNVPCVNDGDLCCPTQRFYTHGTATSRESITGEMCYICGLPFPYPGIHQWFTEGQCCGVQSCSGRCVVEQEEITLLAVGNVTGFGFHKFEIGGYCSCKNIPSPP